jgi:hypothetical protein
MNHFVSHVKLINIFGFIFIEKAIPGGPIGAPSLLFEIYTKVFSVLRKSVF